jgi:hypothetical protein
MYTIITEGNLKAIKDTDDFGGINMWRLYIKDTRGYWEDIQWMSVGRIQKLFNETLPVYEETKKASVITKIN